MILLITKYNLSSRWLHLFTFLIFYLICLKLHYIDLNNNNFVECMMKNPINSPSGSLNLKPVLPNKELFPEAIDTSHFVTVDQLNKSHQELYTNIENNFKKELSTVSTLQTELSNEINTRKVLETRVTNLEEELREIRRALMFRGTIMDPFAQQQATLSEVKQTTQETNIAIIPR